MLYVSLAGRDKARWMREDLGSFSSPDGGQQMQQPVVKLTALEAKTMTPGNELSNSKRREREGE